MIRFLYLLLIKMGNGLQPLVLLAMRLFWGWFFFSGGSEKLSNITPIADYFHSLGIPFPELNAYLAGSIECVGGFCLMIGFAARLVSLPLMVVMIVAMATAHYEAFSNIFSNPLNFTEQTPFNFFFAALLIFTFGPGALSCDGLLKRFFFKTYQIRK